MLEYLIKLAQFAPEIGNVSCASLSDGFIIIDGITTGGDKFYLSFRIEEGKRDADHS